MQLFRSRGLITCNAERDFFEDAFLVVEGSRIKEVGPWRKRPRLSSKRFVDFSHGLIMPGLFNLHCHLAMTAFRGIAEDLTLEEWLQTVIFPLEKRWLSPAFVRDFTNLGLCESLRFGMTYVADMYFYTKVRQQCFEAAGLRGCIGQNTWDLEGPDYPHAAASLEDFLQTQKRHPRRPDGLVERALAPHSPYLCSAETLAAVAQCASEADAGVMIHVAETEFEVQTVKERTGMSPLKMVASSGLLNSRFSLIAHGVKITPDEMPIIRQHDKSPQSRSSIVLNTQCNAKLHSGFAPVADYRNHNIRLTLGTDGPASNNALDLFSEMNFLSKVHHLLTGDLTGLPSHDILEMATIRAAEAVGLSHETGSLEPGKSADFIVVDFRAPHLCPAPSMINHLIHSARGQDVEAVYVRGCALMKQRRLTTLDEAKIRARAEALNKKMRRP